MTRGIFLPKHSCPISLEVACIKLVPCHKNMQVGNSDFTPCVDGLSCTRRLEMKGICCLLALYFIHELGSRHSIRREPNNWSVVYTKQVRFGGLALLDVLISSNK